jgi:hypothetical protein
MADALVPAQSERSVEYWERFGDFGSFERNVNEYNTSRNRTMQLRPRYSLAWAHVHLG